MDRDSDSALDIINSIVLRLDIDGTVLFVNRYAEQFFGINRITCLGHRLQHCISGRGAAAGALIEAMIRHIIKDPSQYQTDYFEIPRSSDLPAWIVWSNKTVINDHGGIDEIIIVGNEMTQYKQLEYDLKDTNNRFKVMLENIQTGVLIIDPAEMIILYINNIAADILGLPKDMIVGEPCGKFCHSGEALCSAVSISGDLETAKNVETAFVRIDGRKIHIIKNSTMVTFRGENFILESFIDISDKKHTEERLINANHQIENLLSSIVSVLIGVSIDDYITHWNKAAENIFGIPESDVMNKPFPLCGIDWEWNRIYEGIADSILLDQITYLQNVSFTNRSGNSGYLDVTINSIIDRNRDITGFLLFGEDVTEKEQNKKLIEEIEHRKKVEAELTLLNVQLELLAKEDVLTGLFTRRFFMEQFESELKRAHRYSTELSLLVIDVDHFKAVNDTHGHLLGDRVLSEIGKTIKSVTRSSDISGRYGGEEFCVFLPISGTESAIITANKLCKAVESCRFKGAYEFAVTCSIGVSTMVESDSTVTEIIKRADDALYRAKSAGRNRVVSG